MLSILVKTLFCPKGSEITGHSANVVENIPLSKAVGLLEFSIEDDYFEDMSKGYRPKNTEASTSWALKKFQTWTSCRNAGEGKERCPTDLLSTNDKPAFGSGLRDLLRRLDARMESPTHQKQSTCLSYEFASPPL